MRVWLETVFELSTQKRVDNSNKHRGSDHGRPEAVFISLGRLTMVGCPEKRSAGVIDRFALVPGLAGIKGNSHGRRKHGCRKILGKIAGKIGRLPEAVVLREITVLFAIPGHGHAD